MPTYTLAERDRRWTLTRSFLSAHGLDGLIVYGEHEDAGAAPYSFDNWLTNDRPGSTIVFPKDGEPIELVPFLNFFVDHMEGLQNSDSIWIRTENMRAGRHADTLIGVLDELELGHGKIGVLGLGPAVPWHPEGLIPFGLWQKILMRFPRATFISVANDFIPLLLPLSDEELEVVRHAANIGEDMAKAMFERIRTGVPENEVYAAAMNLAICRGTVIPWTHMNTGPNAVLWGPPRWAWRPQAPRILETGDLVAAEVFCNYGMHQTQHQLTVFIGPMPEDIVRASGVVKACYDAGLKALRPDARFRDVAAAMLQPVLQAGGWTKGPQIHSLNPLAAFCGFEVPPHVVGKGYPKVEGLHTILADLRLKPGMTFAFEPSCGFGTRGVTIGGTIIVGKDGPIELNPFTAKVHNVL